MAVIRTGISGFSRLPQMRSPASHSTMSAWRTASSYRRSRTGAFCSTREALPRTRVACLRWYPVSATNSSRIVFFSLVATSQYLVPMASINSLRVVMLIRPCFVTSCPRRPIRRVTIYVTQQVISGSKSDESMRAVRVVDAKHGQVIRLRNVPSCSQASAFGWTVFSMTNSLKRQRRDNSRPMQSVGAAYRDRLPRIPEGPVDHRQTHVAFQAGRPCG